MDNSFIDEYKLKRVDRYNGLLFCFGITYFSMKGQELNTQLIMLLPFFPLSNHPYRLYPSALKELA